MNPVIENARCWNCGTIFEVKGTMAILVVTGGVDCPKCGRKNAINTSVERHKR